MTITTINDALAKCTLPVEFVRTYSNTAAGPIWKSTWYQPGGFGGLGTTPTAGLAGQTLSGGVEVYFRYTNPAVGQKKYLCKVSGGQNSAAGITFASGMGSYYIADRLWHNNGIVVTSTGSQTINSVAWPARDVNGTTNGEGVWLGMEVMTPVGSATATATVGYTNSAGTAGRVGTIDMNVINSAQLGNIHMMRADVGDTGVRSVQTFQLGISLVSGTISLVAFRPLAFTYSGYGRVQRSYLGPLDIGFPEFPDDCCPFVGSNGTAAMPYITSEWTFAEG